MTASCESGLLGFGKRTRMALFGANFGSQHPCNGSLIEKPARNIFWMKFLLHARNISNIGHFATLQSKGGSSDVRKAQAAPACGSRGSREDRSPGPAGADPQAARRTDAPADGRQGKGTLRRLGCGRTSDPRTAILPARGGMASRQPGIRCDL